MFVYSFVFSCKVPIYRQCIEAVQIIDEPFEGLKNVLQSCVKAKKSGTSNFKRFVQTSSIVAIMDFKKPGMLFFCTSKRISLKKPTFFS